MGGPVLLGTFVAASKVGVILEAQRFLKACHSIAKVLRITRYELSVDTCDSLKQCLSRVVLESWGWGLNAGSLWLGVPSDCSQDVGRGCSLIWRLDWGPGPLLSSLTRTAAGCGLRSWPLVSHAKAAASPRVTNREKL